MMALAINLFVLIVKEQFNDSTSQAVNKGNNETRPERLLSKGSNKIPVGDLKVLTYKLEEIKPTRIVQVRNKKVSLTGFRLIITVAAF